MTHPAPELQDPTSTTFPSPADTSSAEVAEAEPTLKKGAISPRQALFFGLTALGVPVTLSGFGATLAFSAGYNAWLAVVIGTGVVLLLAAIIVRFSKRHLATGSIMSYLNLEIGPKAGVIGGAALFVGYIAASMLFISLSLIFLVSFLQGIGIDASSSVLQAVVGVVLVAICVTLGRRGVSLSVNAAVILGWVGVPLVLVAMIAAIINHGVDFAPQFSFDGFSLETFIPGVILAIGAFAGFEGFTALAQETTEPRKTIPRLVVTVVIVLGAMALISALFTIPIMLENSDAIIAGASPLSVLATVGGLGWFGPVADALLFLACVGSLLAYINDAGRIIATAGRDGFLPRGLGHIDERRKTPARAILLIGIAGAGGFVVYLLISGEAIYTAFIAFAVFTSYSWLVAYVALSVAGVVDGIRRKQWLFTIGSLVAGLAVLGSMIFNLLTPESGVLPWVALATVALLSVVGIVARRKPTVALAADDEVL